MENQRRNDLSVGYFRSRLGKHASKELFHAHLLPDAQQHRDVQVLEAVRDLPVHGLLDQLLLHHDGVARPGGFEGLLQVGGGALVPPSPG